MAYYYDNGQFIFDRTLQGIWIVIKWLFKAAIYFPLWFAGYVIAAQLLDITDSAFAWVGLIVLFAVALYQIIFFLKGMMIGFMSVGVLLIAMPLMFLCISFTCILPLWLAFDTIQTIALDWAKQSADVFTWVLIIACGLLIYSRYHFLTNIAPLAAYPAYQLGIATSMRLMHVSTYLQAKKSKQLI